jgi:acetolactate synthase-1/2/3 large subunit
VKCSTWNKFDEEAAVLDTIKKLAKVGEATMTGGEVVARMLALEGVERAFGIIDGTYFGLYSAFPRHGIGLLTPRHETSAAHMAGAYARLTGKLGVCIASNGPGVANILPGVAVENAEGNRVLLITSARREGTIAPDRGGTYQSFPQVEVTAPMTKWSCRVPAFGRLAEVMRRALRVSWSGRPGVVHVDVPESILNGRFAVGEGYFRAPAQYRSVEPLHPADAQVERAADLLAGARLPLIHAGSGVLHARASAALGRVAELLHAPVATSWAGRGATSELPGYAIPMIHVDLVRRARCEADLVLVLGSRLGETDGWGKPPHWAPPSRQRVIQVDLDEETLGLHRATELAVVADVRVFLEKLEAALRARASRIDVVGRRSWLASLEDGRAKARIALDRALADASAPLHPAHVGAACRRLFPDDAIAVFDGGNTCIWANFYSEARVPNAFLSTPHMGMLGAGVAQALGAKAAHPAREVYCIIGDGAMGMHVQELETAVRHGLRVVYIVLCDRAWGMVKMNQSFTMRPVKTLVMGALAPGENLWTDLAEVDFAAMARATGAHGERVASPAELEAAIERCRRQERPAVIHVDVDPVKHAWAPGLRHFKDLHAEPKG